jgi:spore maturation protein CgeB
MKVLFVGQTWKGSSARSLKEGLQEIPDIEIEEVGEDHYKLKGLSVVTRAANRVLGAVQRDELKSDIFRKIHSYRPDVLLVYKGNLVSKKLVAEAKRLGLFTVNIFPDVSPHAHGARLKQAMGEYDLVISTKPFHPANWSIVYGYANSCVCVPHGYDPEVHFWSDIPSADSQIIDVALAATWRPQYEKIMLDFAKHTEKLQLKVILAGNGWEKCRKSLPPSWSFPGGLYGRSYGDLLRRSKIVIAPVHRTAFVNGQRQPGDEDTTRSYELAAAGCFFLHQRTPYIQSVYSESTEVPMWDSAEELARQVEAYLARPDLRFQMAQRAHEKAVPSFSTQSRALEVACYLRRMLPNISSERTS